MSDDWATKYIDIHKQRQQEKQDAQKRRRLAEAGAPDMFQRLKNRVHQDLKTFHEAGVLRSLEFREVPIAGLPRGFTVNDMSPKIGPHPTLMVALDVILVQYHHFFPPRGAQESHQSEGSLRICSDLDGVTQIYKNGDAFADESEVAEFLLRSLLDFVDG